MQLVIPLLPRNRTLPRSGAPLRRLVVVWTSLALLALVLVATARAANPPIVQKYYLPYPEHDLLITLTNLWGNRSTVASSIQYFPTNPMTTYATITVPLAGTVVYYDHWEDGYESDLAKPQQSTTQVWGDGDPTNGSAPGVPGDVIPAGRVIVLFNQLDSRTLQAVIDYDARDKIGASKGVAVVRSGWASQSNTLMAGAVEVFHTGIWGTDYRAPIGESPSIPQTDHYDQFDYVAFFISAGEGGATVNIDKDNNGVFETTVTLAEGESHRVHGGVQLGGRVTSDRPVQVILFAADWGGFFETRDSSLLPTTSWGSDYYAPVSTPASVTWLSQGNPTTFTPPSVVWLYNPNAGSITVNREWRVGSGSLSTASSAIAGGGYLKVNLVDTAAYRFYTTGSPAPVFYGWSATDAGTFQAHTDGSQNATGQQVNQGWDWAFSLIPNVWLSPQIICGLGIGRDPTSATSPSENGNPVWISTVGNGETAVTVYVDYNGNGLWDGNGANPGLDPNGFGYDISYSLKELQQQKIYDPDGDQTGMLVYVLAPGVKLAAAWGQDPVNYDGTGDDTNNLRGASPGAPGLDVGTSIPPLPVADAGKSASVATDSDNDGQPGPGDVLEYDIRVINDFRGDLVFPVGPPPQPLVIKDTLPADTTYVPGSTKYRLSTGSGTAWGAWMAIADGGGGAFPLGGAGAQLFLTLPKLEQLQIVFRAQVDGYADLTPGTTAIVNTGTVELSPYGLVIPLNASTPLHGSLGDRVWADTDGNGVQDGGEAGINGVRVYVDSNGNAVYDAGEPTAITAGDGAYLITGLPAGSYTVRVDSSTLPGGYGPTFDLDGVATANLAVVPLAAGQDRTDVDFGYQPGLSLGDRVWLDRDADGVQEAGEPGINGVRVYLDLNGNNQYDGIEPNAITAGDGDYIIGGLLAGSYDVRVDTTTLPAGLTQTYDLTSPPAGFDHEAAVVLANSRTDVDFGYRGSFSLGDRVWNDANGDGSQSSESGINGVVVFLDLNGNGVRDNNEPSATTATVSGTSGSYTIGNLPPGTYTVRVDPSGPLAGYGQTYDLDGIVTPHVAVATITNANRTDVDFGYRGRANLGDRVWSDANSNGQQDSGEVGINGVRVYLDANGNNVYDVGEAHAFTSGDGNYTIGNLAAGTYSVRVDTTTLPGGAVQTYDLTPAQLDHEASRTLTATQNATDVDFGYTLPTTASLGDRVWRDDNGNGVQDPGEPGLNGVTVFIDLNNDGQFNAGEPTAGTNGDGDYLFSNLTAGTYVVRVDSTTLPAGFVQTSDLNGSLDHRADANLLTGQARTDVDFGYRWLGVIGNQVWYDANNNGLREGGEPGLEDVVVILDADLNGDGDFEDPGEMDYATTDTDANGNYLFSNLPPGRYRVLILDPPASAPLASSVVDFTDNQQDDDNNGLQEDGAGFPVYGPVIELSADEQDLTMDFGFTTPATLGDRVWEDTNDNGLLDSGEVGLEGIAVCLDADLDNDGDFEGAELCWDTAITDADGYYLFENLPPGRYRVVINTPPAEAPLSSTTTNNAPEVDDNDDGNQTSTGQPVSSAVILLDSGDDNRTVDFGFVPLSATAVTLAYFQASAEGGAGVRLGWQTLVENETLGFYVERAAGAGAWERITPELIPATGGTQRPQTYTLRDTAPPAAANLTYRLIEVELDGQEDVVAEAALRATFSTRLRVRTDGLSLEVQGLPQAKLVVETAPTVNGPWSAASTLELDGAGQGILRLPWDREAAGRFYRILE